MKEVIRTANAPGAVGPYSQAVAVDRWVWVSGQIPIDPATGEMVDGGIEREAEQVLANLRAVLEAAGSSIAGVVKATVYLVDMADFAAVNGGIRTGLRRTTPRPGLRGGVAAPQGRPGGDRRDCPAERILRGSEASS